MVVVRAILLLAVLNLEIFLGSPALHRTQIASDVEQRVQAGDLTPTERNWEHIGWLKDMDQAVTLSRQVRRPIFVLAAEGNLDGRC